MVSSSFDSLMFIRGVCCFQQLPKHLLGCLVESKVPMYHSACPERLCTSARVIWDWLAQTKMMTLLSNVLEEQRPDSRRWADYVILCAKTVKLMSGPPHG